MVVLLISIDPVREIGDELIMKNTYMNSLKQKQHISPGIVDNTTKIKWIDEDKKSPLVTIINPPKNTKIKRPKYSAFERLEVRKVYKEPIKKDTKKLNSDNEHINVLGNMDYTPVKINNFIKAKPQIRTISFTDETIKKKINVIPNVIIHDENNKNKNLKIVSYKKLKKEPEVTYA